MSDFIKTYAPFEPPRISKAAPRGLKLLRGLAIAICVISTHTVVAGVLGSGFAGSNVGIIISLLWAIPAAGSAFVVSWTNRRIEDRL